MGFNVPKGGSGASKKGGGFNIPGRLPSSRAPLKVSGSPKLSAPYRGKLKFSTPKINNQEVLNSQGSDSPEQLIASAFSERVVADSGTIESLSCVTSGIENIYDVGAWDKFPYVLIPSAYKVSKIYSVKPATSDLTYTRAGVRNRINSSGVQESLLANFPAIDYYGSSCPAILLEPQRTNLFLNSATLATQSITVTAAAHTISFYGTGSITLSGAHVAVINGTGANQRVSLTFTPSAGTLTCTVSGTVQNANAELGDYATSWITTTGATATRTADSISDLTAVSSLIGQSEGALYLEFETSSDAAVKQVSVSDGTANNRITISCNGTTLSGSVTVGGVSQASPMTTLTANTRYRAMLTYRPNRVALYVNGVKVAEDTAATIPACSAISFRRNAGSSNNPFFGRIFKFAVANQVIFDAEAERITDNTTNSSTFDIDSDFDTLSLHSDTQTDFVLSGSNITQWNSRSGSITHATGSGATLVSGIPTFDGVNDYLQLSSEFSGNEYTAFVVCKASSLPTARRVLLGGLSADDFIAMEEEATQTRRLRVNNVASGGLDRNFRLWGEEYYAVIAVRRDATTIYSQTNGRELITLDGSSSAVVSKIGYIGRSSGGNYFHGAIRSVCIHSDRLSNDDTEKILNDLFARYNLPETSDAVVGFGDSITFGSAASNRLTTAWLPVLGGMLGKPFKNFGISGSSLSGTTGDGGYARYSRQLIENPYSDTICILYGTNDTTGGVTSQTYQYALENIVKGLLLAGYPANKIILGTIPYQLGDANAVTIAALNTVITNVCTLFGLKPPADVYNAMKNNGGDALMDDTVHPNTTGHTLIANTFLAVINS